MMQRKGRSLTGPFFRLHAAAGQGGVRPRQTKKNRAGLGLRGFFVIRVGDLT